jgi:hypothetical protein
MDLDRYARDALKGGLYVVKPDGSPVAIPPVADPTVVDLSSISADAHVLVRAAVKAAERLSIEDIGAATDFERACLRARRKMKHPLTLATSRVDYMSGKALEINTTIPAMQGYADIVAAAYLRDEELIERNGRNTDDLIDALLEIAPHARMIAIVAREGDAQRGELLHYVARMAQRGIAARIVTPAQIRIAGTRIEAAGDPVELVYRHIFAWRVDPTSDFACALLTPDQFPIVNPVCFDVEAKATLAELSRATDANESWLSPDQRDVIARRVPWTRKLDAATATRAEREREHMVLKRSWDYGGRAVFLGIDMEEAKWREQLDKALAPGDVWIVQERVDAPIENRTVVGRGAIDCYVDLCAFASLGLRTMPKGGASRVAPTRIVNILGGGGLAPVLTPEVFTLVRDGASSRASSS